MARVISFDDLNGSNTEYIAPELRIVSPDDPPIFVGDENGSGGGVMDITPHGIRIPNLTQDDPPYVIRYPTDPRPIDPKNEVTILGDTLPVTQGGGVLMTMTGAQGGSATQTGTNGAPVADLTAKIQTLAAEKPLLVFGAIGLGLYLLLKDKK